MGIAPHIARLRAFVGHEMLLLPSVAVLPADEAGRVLLAWQAGHRTGWSTVGGAVERPFTLVIASPGFSPALAAGVPGSVSAIWA